MGDLKDVIRMFEATGLDGREITSVAVADTGEVGFELDIAGDQPVVGVAARALCMRAAAPG